MATIQQQVTSLYDQLTDINNAISSRALNSRVTTVNTSLSNKLDLIAASLISAEDSVKAIQLDLANVITELRSK